LANRLINPRPDTVAMTSVAATAAQSGFRRKWLFYASVVLALPVAAKDLHVPVLLKQALDWVGKLGPWAAVVFIGIYVVATVLFIPGSVLTLGAGANCRIQSVPLSVMKRNSIKMYDKWSVVRIESKV